MVKRDRDFSKKKKFTWPIKTLVVGGEMQKKPINQENKQQTKKPH